MMVEVSHLVDIGILIVVGYVTFSINNLTNLLVDIAEKHNNLAAMFKEFSQAVVDDMEEIEKALNDQS